MHKLHIRIRFPMRYKLDHQITVTEQFPQSMPPYFHAMHACGPLLLCQGRELWESAKPGKPAWSG